MASRTEIADSYEERQNSIWTVNPHSQREYDIEMLREGRRFLATLWEDVVLETPKGITVFPVGVLRNVFDMAIKQAKQEVNEEQLKADIQTALDATDIKGRPITDAMVQLAIAEALRPFQASYPQYHISAEFDGPVLNVTVRYMVPMEKIEVTFSKAEDG
jgi:hypothetical protein